MSRSKSCQEAEDKRSAEVKANYTKYEYRIPMRNGMCLFTAVYVPKDQSRTYPILLMRTPYSVRPYGADDYLDGLLPSPLFERPSPPCDGVFRAAFGESSR